MAQSKPADRGSSELSHQAIRAKPSEVHLTTAAARGAVFGDSAALMWHQGSGRQPGGGTTTAAVPRWPAHRQQPREPLGPEQQGSLEDDGRPASPRPSSALVRRLWPAWPGSALQDSGLLGTAALEGVLLGERDMTRWRLFLDQWACPEGHRVYLESKV